MPPTKIDDDANNPDNAFSKLQSLAIWVHESAEMKQEARNLLKCVDEDRLEMTLPLLKALGYAQMKVRKRR